MPDKNDDDILEIRTGGTPLRAQRRLAALEDQIPAEPAVGGGVAAQSEALPAEAHHPAPPPNNAPMMASEPSGLSPPPELTKTQWLSSSRIHGPGDAFAGRILNTYYGSNEPVTGLAQGINVERSMLGYGDNNDPYAAPVPSAAGQPTVAIASAQPFPPRHDQLGYIVTAGDEVLIATGRDGRKYFVNDELPFVGKVKSVDFENGTVKVTRQALSANPDGASFHGATFTKLLTSAGADVDVDEVLVLHGAPPLVDDYVYVRRRGRYYFVEGRTIRWGRATAPELRGKATGDGGAAEVNRDQCAWIRPGPTLTPYVYVWPSDVEGLPPALNGGSADDFHKVYLPGSECHEPNVRDGDTVRYYESNDEYWIGPGGWYDDPVWTLRMWGAFDADFPVPAGWALMNQSTAEVYHPNTDVDTLGDRVTLPHPITYNFDLRQFTPIGAGDEPFLPGSGVDVWQREALAFEQDTCSPPDAGIAYFGIHYILRVN